MTKSKAQISIGCIDGLELDCGMSDSDLRREVSDNESGEVRSRLGPDNESGEARRRLPPDERSDVDLNNDDRANAEANDEELAAEDDAMSLVDPGGTLFPVSEEIPEDNHDNPESNAEGGA
jgi:hypothetical protein